MLEVEMKFPAPDFAAVETVLARWHAAAGLSREEADHYFNAPDRDFAVTDEALRLRRIGEENYVTYKGPKRDLQTKTRTEVEVPLAPGDAAAEGFIQVLTHLGYRAVAVVRKRRRKYHLQRDGFPVEVSLDEVDGVGRYIELEIVAPESALDPARDTVLRLASEMGLKDSERRSYMQLLLTARPGAPVQ